MKHKCECPEVGNVRGREYLYSDEEKAGMNHEAGKCKGTYKLKQYIRNGKKLWLCSCCFFFGDEEVK
jgi:hypothetical protein